MESKPHKKKKIETILKKKLLVKGRRESERETESGEEEKSCILITKGHKNKGLRKVKSLTLNIVKVIGDNYPYQNFRLFVIDESRRQL